MAIAFLTSVESTFSQSGGGSTPSVDTTGADLIVASVSYFNTGFGMSFQDSEGNTWTQIANTLMPAEIGLRWYYCINPTTSATQTFTYNGTNVYCAIHAHAYTQGGLIVAYDTESSAYGSGLAQTSGLITPANDNSLVVSSQAGRFLTDSQSVDEGLTKREETPFVAGLRMSLVTGSKIQTPAAAINPEWSSGISDSRVVGVAAFYEVPIPPTKTPLIIDEGVIQQLQSGDVLTDVVYSASDLTPDNAIVRVDGTDKDVQTSTALIADTGALTLAQDATLETSGAHDSIFQLRDSTGTLTFEISAQVGGEGNVGFGEGTLTGITTGQKNLCIGTSAGRIISTGSSNICVGRNSGYDVTSGGSNILMGASAGQNIVDGSRNIMMGESSGNVIVSGDDNIGFGNAVLASATGSDNIGIGRNAGRTLTTGGTSTFVGNEAGYNGSQLVSAVNSTALGNQAYTTASNQVVIGNTNVTETVLQGKVIVESKAAFETSGAHTPTMTIKDSTGAAFLEVSAQTAALENLCVGLNAGDSITTGYSNACFGTNAGAQLANGYRNLCVGVAAGFVLTSGYNNMFIGYGSGLATTTGGENSAIGRGALDANISGWYNTAVGSFSISAATTVSGNTAIGYKSYEIGTAAANTCIGYEAGASLTTGIGNIIIGYGAGDASQVAGVVNNIVLGYLAYGTKSNQAVLGASSITETVLRGNVLTGDGAYNTLKMAAKTADYTIVDDTFVAVDSTAAAVTITLPLAATWTGTPFHVKKVDSSANAVTIDANGAETIDGQLTATITVQYTNLTFVSDGTEWWII